LGDTDCSRLTALVDGWFGRLKLFEYAEPTARAASVATTRARNQKTTTRHRCRTLQVASARMYYILSFRDTQTTILRY
jgi:hypothetical protein